jgi:hypothetical protein
MLFQSRQSMLRTAPAGSRRVAIALRSKRARTPVLCIRESILSNPAPFFGFLNVGFLVLSLDKECSYTFRVFEIAPAFCPTPYGRLASLVTFGVHGGFYAGHTFDNYPLNCSHWAILAAKYFAALATGNHQTRASTKQGN